MCEDPDLVEVVKEPRQGLYIPLLGALLQVSDALTKRTEGLDWLARESTKLPGNSAVPGCLDADQVLQGQLIALR